MPTRHLAAAPVAARQRGRDRRTFSWTSRLAALLAAVVLLTQASLSQRLEEARKQPDRGDIPGWAIAAGASVVLGLLVWAAVQGVVGTYIGKINGGSK